MYARQAACRKTSGTKLSTSDKKAHARKTHSPAGDKRRARNKTAMRPCVPRPSPLSLCLSPTFRKQKTHEKSSEKRTTFYKKRDLVQSSRVRKGQRVARTVGKVSEGEKVAHRLEWEKRYQDDKCNHEKYNLINVLCGAILFAFDLIWN